MKDMKSDQRGPAKPSKPVMTGGKGSNSPVAKSPNPIASSAPSDPHTMGRVSGKDWLK